MGIVKNENYFVTYGWMTNELGLKGLELDVYAIIYGFSQTENQWFTGSLRYLSEFSGCTKQGAQKVLSSLIEKNLIQKKEVFENNQKKVYYRAVEFTNGYTTQLYSTDKGIQLSCIGVYNIVVQGIQLSCIGYTTELPDTYIYNIDNKLDEKKEEKILSDSDYEKPKSRTKTKAESIPDWFEEVWKMYPRKKGKSSVTKDAFKAMSKAGKETIIMAIQNYCYEIKKNRTAEQYILHGSTFFNGRWQDYVNQDDSQGRSELKHDERYGKLV